MKMSGELHAAAASTPGNGLSTQWIGGCFETQRDVDSVRKNVTSAILIDYDKYLSEYSRIL
jgi:hypothetical protein